MNCVICGTLEPSFAWTDTHGVAQCWTCGTPYRLLHYEGEGDARHAVDRPPEHLMAERYVPAIQAYWKEKRRRIPSGFSFPGGQELASPSEEAAFYAWMQEHEYLPKP